MHLQKKGDEHTIKQQMYNEDINILNINKIYFCLSDTKIKL